MRKLALTGLTLTIVLALAGIAIAQYAQPTVTVTEAKVTPSKAGTAKKPANGRTHIVFTVPDSANATLSGIKYTFDSGLKIDPAGFKACPINTAAKDACPKGSQVGTGAATAGLGPAKSPLIFKAKVFYGGGNKITLFLQQTNNQPNTSPVTATFPGTFTKTSVKFNIPTTVQSPVPGLYSYVSSVTADLGKGAGSNATATTGKGKKKKKHYFLSVVGCKGGKHTLGAEAFFAANPNPPAVQSAKDTQTVSCKK